MEFLSRLSEKLRLRNKNEELWQNIKKQLKLEFSNGKYEIEVEKLMV